MIDKIRYWCHKILPLVYDDSLSYYEFLCKMNAKLNEVIDSTNGLVEVWEKFQAELEKAWQDYKSALTAEWTDYKAEMDLKYASLVGTVNTEINAMKNDISTFKNDISTQINEFETKVNGDYAEFTAAIEEKINTFIAKYNAEIAKIPDEITTLVNAWWQNVENYNKLVTDVAAAIGTTLSSGAVTFSTVGAMTSATAATLPVKTIAVCSNYYNTDGIYTLWVIVSGDVSDGVSRLGIGNGVTIDRTAILLSERNADTLGLRGASALSLERKLLTMCKNNYKYLKITSNGLSIPMPSAADVGSASITPLAIYGTNKKISTTLTFKTGDCNTVESISTLSLTISGQGATTFISRCAIHDCDVIPQINVTFNHVDFDTVWWRSDGLTFAPIDTDSRPMVKNSRFSLVTNQVKLIATAFNPKGIAFINNSFYLDRGAELVSSWAFLDIDGNAMPITLRDNFCYTGSEASATTIMVLANCKNFVETGKVLICEGNRNEVGGVSHPYTMFTGDIPSDIVYVNNAIRFGNTYALSDIPTTGSFEPARVMGVTHPIGYLRTAENQAVVQGTPLTLTYPRVSYWTADEGGGISLSSDKNALYKVTFKGIMAVSGQVAAGNVKISLKGLATDSRTFTLLSSMEYAPISFEFYWGTGGGFTVEVSSETENMTVIIRKAELLIERLK
jgi:hypothetical protein